jgi:hypothetical protein
MPSARSPTDPRVAPAQPNLLLLRRAYLAFCGARPSCADQRAAAPALPRRAGATRTADLVPPMDEHRKPAAPVTTSASSPIQQPRRDDRSGRPAGARATRSDTLAYAGVCGSRRSPGPTTACRPRRDCRLARGRSRSCLLRASRASHCRRPEGRRPGARPGSARTTAPPTSPSNPSPSCPRDAALPLGAIAPTTVVCSKWQCGLRKSLWRPAADRRPRFPMVLGLEIRASRDSARGSR